MSEQPSKPAAPARRWVVIPAAGVGRRFGGTTPKQYLDLAGRTVLERTLEVFLGHPTIAGVVVALGAEDGWWADSVFADHPRISRATGGAERCHSVANALNLLAGTAHPDDWVLVHDAARPCLRRADLDRLLAALVGEPVGALLAVPLHDTVKQADSANCCERTLPRSALWRAYTPQAFRIGLLQRALAEADERGLAVTDDAGAVELLGLKPRLIEGHADNLKITRPEDLPLAAFFLGQQGRVG